MIGIKWRFFQTSKSVLQIMAAVLRDVSILSEVITVNVTKGTWWTAQISMVVSVSIGGESTFTI